MVFLFFSCQDWREKLNKSIFCKSFVPASLQAYYADQLDILGGNSAEEADIQRHNEAFYCITSEEETFRSHFRAATQDEPCELLSLADILEVLREHHRGPMRNINLAHFGSALVASGVERLGEG